jgi:DNA helicase TIP49 (TBP-interacting protein)
MAEGPQPKRTGSAGRIPGVPNRDKAELRALIQEKVHEFTAMRREQDIAALPPELSVEEGEARGLVQIVCDDYDPVVAMSLTAMDRKVTLEMRTKCHAEVAQYVRPKLKSVDVTVDPEALETLEQRRELSDRLTQFLETAASATKPERPTQQRGPDAS